jgi:hypothetical protein
MGIVNPLWTITKTMPPASWIDRVSAPPRRDQDPDVPLAGTAEPFTVKGHR